MTALLVLLIALWVLTIALMIVGFITKKTARLKTVPVAPPPTTAPAPTPPVPAAKISAWIWIIIFALVITATGSAIYFYRIPGGISRFGNVISEQAKTSPKITGDEKGKENKQISKKQGKMVLVFSEELKGGKEKLVHFTPGEYSTPDEIYLSRNGKSFVCVGPGNFEVSITDPRWMKIKTVQSGKVSIFEIQYN